MFYPLTLLQFPDRLSTSSACFFLKATSSSRTTLSPDCISSGNHARGSVRQAVFAVWTTERASRLRRHKASFDITLGFVKGLALPPCLPGILEWLCLKTAHDEFRNKEMQVKTSQTPQLENLANSAERLVIY